MDKKLLEQIVKLFESNTALLRKEMQEMNMSLRRDMQEMKAELKKAIEKSQEETIETLSDLIVTGHDMHEKRIKKLENNLNLPQVQ